MYVRKVKMSDLTLVIKIWSAQFSNYVAFFTTEKHRFWVFSDFLRNSRKYGYDTLGRLNWGHSPGRPRSHKQTYGFNPTIQPN